MDENDDDQCKEVTGVDVLLAWVEEEDAYEESKGGDVHEGAEDKVKGLQLVLEHWLVILDGNARVDDDAKRDEVAPLGQEHEQEDADEVVMSELVDAQISDEEELDAEECLQFGPAFDLFLVLDGAPDHLNYHHSDLETDPALLTVVTDRSSGFFLHWLLDLRIYVHPLL